MIDKVQAIAIVNKHLEEIEDNDTGPLQLVPEYTVEKEFGWVFFWDSRKHLETGNIEYALAGNSPFIVDRRDGSIHETGTAYPIERYIAEYENKDQRRSS